MFINIDYRKNQPIYEQIVNEVERFVAAGAIAPGEKIPSVRVLASELGINPNTVKKAYDLLEEKKVIVTLSTKGTFISEDIKAVRDERVNKIYQDVFEKIEELKKLGISEEEFLKTINKKF